MLQKILIPTDFSKGFEMAIERFAKKNKMSVGEIILLHVVDFETIDTLVNGKQYFYESEVREVEDIEGKLIKKSLQDLEILKKFLIKAIDVKKIKVLVRVGTPYEEIVKTAEQEDVSLIMLPSHGKLSFSHEIFGSTTMRVIKKTTRPVLLIKTYKED